MSKAYIGLLENGRRQLNQDKIERIARALNVTEKDILDIGEYPEDLREHIDIIRSLPRSARENVYTYAKTVQKAERA